MSARSFLKSIPCQIEPTPLDNLTDLRETYKPTSFLDSKNGTNQSKMEE